MGVVTQGLVSLPAASSITTSRGGRHLQTFRHPAPPAPITVSIQSGRPHHSLYSVWPSSSNFISSDCPLHKLSRFSPDLIGLTSSGSIHTAALLQSPQVDRWSLTVTSEGCSDRQPGRTPRPRFLAIAAPVLTRMRSSGYLSNLGLFLPYVQSQPPFMARRPTCPFRISLSHLKFRPPTSEFDTGVRAVSPPKASINSTSIQGRKGGTVNGRLETLLCMEPTRFTNTRRHVLSPSNLLIPTTRSPSFIRLPVGPTTRSALAAGLQTDRARRRSDCQQRPICFRRLLGDMARAAEWPTCRCGIALALFLPELDPTEVGIVSHHPFPPAARVPTSSRNLYYK